MKRYLQLIAIAFSVTLGGQPAFVNAQDKSKDKVALFKGRVFRSDTKQPIPNARVFLADEKKSEKRDNSQEASTDAEGNFSFDRVAAGKYSLTIRAEFDREDDVPCRINLGKLADNTDPSMAAISQLLSQNVTMSVEVKNGKDKMLISVKPENKKFVEQAQIKNLALKANEKVVREFDLACAGLPK